MTKKYSSFKDHQLITENWRKFLAEEADSLPRDVEQALDILADGPLEEAEPPELMDLPITRKSLAAKLSQGSGGEAAAKRFTDQPAAVQMGVVALGNALTATAKGAELVKKGGDAAAAEVKKYLEQNPDKAEALQTIKKAIRKGGDTAGRILKKVALLAAAGALAAFVAYGLYDAATSPPGSGATSTYDPYVDYSSGQPVPR